MVFVPRFCHSEIETRLAALCRETLRKWDFLGKRVSVLGEQAGEAKASTAVTSSGLRINICNLPVLILQRQGDSGVQPSRLALVACHFDKGDQFFNVKEGPGFSRMSHRRVGLYCFVRVLMQLQVQWLTLAYFLA